MTLRKRLTNSQVPPPGAAWRKKYSVGRDKSLAAFCEEIVQVLIRIMLIRLTHTNAY